MDTTSGSTGGAPKAGNPAPGSAPAGGADAPGSGKPAGPVEAAATAAAAAKTGLAKDSYAGIVVWGVIGLVVAGFYLAGFIKGMEELEIVAAAQPAPVAGAPADGAKQLAVSGMVVWDGEPLEGARVWGVAGTDSGNRVAIQADTSKPDGTFNLKPVDATIGDQEVSSVQVHATGTRPVKGGAKAGKQETGTKLRGREIIRTGKAAAGATALRTRRVAPPVSLIALLGVSLVCFFLSLGAASSRVPAATRYFLSLALAFVLIMTMSLALAMGMMYVSTRGVPGDLFSFGFASVVYGAPSAEVAREWVFSLTTPETDGAKGGLTGFYAPLWVMLLSVLGAGLLTLSLLLTEIRNPPNLAQDDDDVRRRIQNIVMHQFFILFAPLGAIFVYQALLVAKAAAVPWAVAVAALGAGVSLNALLKVAVDKTTRLFEAPAGGGTGGAGTGGAGAGAGRAAGRVEPAAVSLTETGAKEKAGAGTGH